jgi:hypothetical protein
MRVLEARPAFFSFLMCENDGRKTTSMSHVTVIHALGASLVPRRAMLMGVGVAVSMSMSMIVRVDIHQQGTFIFGTRLLQKLGSLKYVIVAIITVASRLAIAIPKLAMLFAVQPHGPYQKLVLAIFAHRHLDVVPDTVIQARVTIRDDSEWPPRKMRRPRKSNWTTFAQY